MIKSLLSLTLISLIIVACSPESRDKYTKPEQGIGLAAFASGKVIPHKQNRNVEVVFVIDPSSSMASIIKEVHDNFDQFAKQFLEDKNSIVHFRIGVVTAWDAVHFARLEVAKFNLANRVNAS